MKKNSLIILVYFLFGAFTSCENNRGEKNSGNYMSKEPSLKDTTYFENGMIDRVKSYNDNGDIIALEFWQDGKQRKILHYINVHGSVIPNEQFVFGPNDDTLNDKSLYYSIYCVNDTINTNEKYQFKVNLEGHMFDKAVLYLCDGYGKNFDLVSTSPCDNVFEMKNFEGPSLARRPRHTGWNYIRGRIDNYSCFPEVKVNGEDSCAVAEVYIVDSFYVIPQASDKVEQKASQ